MAILDLSFIGEVAKAAEGISGQYNKDFQNAQVAIADSNARAAEAMASSTAAAPKSNTIIWVSVIAAIIIIALIVMLKEN